LIASNLEKSLPAVEDLLGKTRKIMDANGFPSDLEGADEPAEDLMLIALQQQKIGAAGPVQDRGEGQVDIPALGNKLPRTQEIVFAVSPLRNLESDIIQFIGILVDKKHILAGFRGIPEAIAEVPADSMAVLAGIKRRPVAGVLIRPDAPAPVQNAIEIAFAEVIKVIAVSLPSWSCRKYPRSGKSKEACAFLRRG
jgi:hypothetical protein